MSLPHAPMTTIQIRIDNETKKSAKRVLDKLGLDMSAAIKVFLKQVVIQQGVPFPILTENGLTPKEEQEILKASREASRGKNVSKPMEVEEAIEYLKKL